MILLPERINGAGELPAWQIDETIIRIFIFLEPQWSFCSFFALDAALEKRLPHPHRNFVTLYPLQSPEDTPSIFPEFQHYEQRHVVT